MPKKGKKKAKGPEFETSGLHTATQDLIITRPFGATLTLPAPLLLSLSVPARLLSHCGPARHRKSTAIRA